MALERDEVIDILRKIMEGEGTQEEDEIWTEQLSQTVPYYQEIFNIIATSNEDLSPEDVLDRAQKKYKPIILP